MEALLPELDNGRFSVWPHCDDARSYYQMQGYRCLGFAAIHRGEEEVAQRLAEQSIALAERIGAPLLKTEGLHMLSHALIYQGDCQQAEKHARELLQITRAYGQEGQTFGTIALWTIGLALAGQGSYVRARACFRRTVAWGRENGPYLVQSLHHLGGAELALGNFSHAKRFYREMLSVCEDLGIQYGVVPALTGLARVALATGKLAEAKQHLLGALKIPPRSRVLKHTIEAIAIMAELRQAEGQCEAAVELCAALLNWPATPNYAPEMTQYLRKELAARLRQLEAQLSPEVFVAATARGRQRQIDEVVAELIGEPARQATDDAAALI
jgi:tetratricopeptide (TPR) repeat protein